jgi:hypothetical protein
MATTLIRETFPETVVETASDQLFDGRTRLS